MLICIQKYFEQQFYATGNIIHEPGMDHFNQPGWVNKIWESSLYRRAHIDVVDARESKGLWMMHCCVFPHTHNPAPIFGFDVIAGKNKITGCFIDYSPAGDANHLMIRYFDNEVCRYDWSKKRKLPEWAERIFSEHMVAAGNVSDESELRQLTSLTHILINYYLETVGDTNNTIMDTTASQNYYCENQKQNPHTSKVMISLGLSETDVKVFTNDYLFPKLQIITLNS